MNFSCTQCQRRYSIADEKVRGKTVKVRCKNCQNVISVEGPPLELEESTRVVSLADVERLREQDRSLAEDVSAAEASPSPQQSWEDEPTRAMPLRDTRAPWFVMVRSKQEGPLDEGALRELVEAGTVTPRSYFWQQGMPDWKRGADLPELAGIFSAPAAPEPAPPLPEPLPEPTSRSATSWQPEPPAPSQTSWQPEPRQEDVLAQAGDEANGPWARQDAESTALPGGTAPLGELFSDLDLPKAENTHPGFSEGLGGLSARKTPEPEPDDDSQEETRTEVKKTGGARRGPARRIALFAVLLLVVPVAVLFAVTELQLVPLRVTRVDAKGRAVEQPVSVFSAEGMGALKNLLLGVKQAPPAPPAPQPETKRAPSGAEKTEAPKPEAAPAPSQGEEALAVAALSAGGEKQDGDAEVGQDAEVAATEPAEPSGPPREELDRVVDKSQSAFKSCIDRGLRKSPKLRGSKVTLTATVSGSGKVRKAVFDREDLEDTILGNCLKARARRMVFPAFAGDDVEVEIPLALGKSM